MSIANKIQRLQSAKANIKSAIEQKGVTVGDGTIDTYAEKIGQISGGGSEDYLQYAQTAQYIRRDLIDQKEITVNLNALTTLQNLFRFDGFSETSNKKVEHITVNCPNAVTSIGAVFHSASPNDTVLKRITFNVDTSKATAATNMCRGCEALETIDGTPLDFSSMVGTNINFLNLCLSLVDIRFAPNTIKLSIDFRSCSNLSPKTIQSIIDGLATVDTAQTLALHADVKMLQSQVDSANAKGWTIAGGTVVSEEEYYG